MLLADSAVRSAEAAAAGTALEPQDSKEVRVQRFVQAVTLRYGEVKQLEVLSVLAGAATTSLGPHWLGLVDIDGQLNLDGLMRQKQQGVDAAGDGKQKVELNLEQLGLLGQ